MRNKRFGTIIAVCILILLTCGLTYYGSKEWTAGYIRGYDAAMNARDAELKTRDDQHTQEVRFLFELDNQWIEKLKADCLKWKPKQPTVVFDPLTAQ